MSSEENLTRGISVFEGVLTESPFIAYDFNLFKHIFNRELLFSAIKAAVHREPLLNVNVFNRNGVFQLERVKNVNIEPEYIQTDDKNLTNEFMKISNMTIPEAGVDKALYRFTVFEGKTSSVLALKFHHLIGDYLSLKIFLNSVLKYYSSFCRGEPYDPNHEDNRTLPMPSEGSMLEYWSNPDKKKLDQSIEELTKKIKDFKLTIPYKPIPDLTKVVPEKEIYFDFIEGTETNLNLNLQAAKNNKVTLSLVSIAASIVSTAILSAERTGKLKHLVTIEYSKDLRREIKQYTNRIMNLSDCVFISEFPVDLTKSFNQIIKELKIVAELESRKDSFLYLNSLFSILGNKEKNGVKETLERNHQHYLDCFIAPVGRTPFKFEYDLGKGKKLVLQKTMLFAYPFGTFRAPLGLSFYFHKTSACTNSGLKDDFNRKIAQKNLKNFFYLIETYHQNAEEKIVDLMPKIEKLSLGTFKQLTKF